jgi:hypothetical protein
VYPESEFDEVILFDVPRAYADELCLRLKPHHLAWLHQNEEGDLFVVSALRVERDDLARLLREVQAWIAYSDVPYLIFLLDGREYELRAPAVPLAA